MSDKELTNKQDKAVRDDAAMMPPVNVVEDSSGIVLYADLPGVPKENLNVHLESDVLTIEGDIKLDTPEGLETNHAEVTLPRFRRVFTLSKELDTTKVQAEFKHGVLKLNIPKAEHAQPRKIAITVA